MSNINNETMAKIRLNGMD